MADIKIEIKNIAAIKAAFSASPRLMTRHLNTAIRFAGTDIEREMRTNISGRMVKVQTGRLRSSSYSRFANLRGEVGTNTEYDIFVHDGTRFMRARPYLKAAVDSKDTNTQQRFTEAVQKTLDDIGKMT